MGIKSIKSVAFEELYEMYKDLVLKTAMYYAGDRHTAEDIMQDAFLRYYIYMEHTDIENAKAWLLVVTKNIAYSHIKKHRKENLVDVSEQREDVFGLVDSPEDCCLQQFNRSQMVEAAHTILDVLHEKNEQWFYAVTMVYGLGKPQKEVAECMGMSLESFHSMLYRARNWIKKHYEKELEDIIIS